MDEGIKILNLIAIFMYHKMYNVTMEKNMLLSKLYALNVKRKELYYSQLIAVKALSMRRTGNNTGLDIPD